MACYPFGTLLYNFKPFWTLCFFSFSVAEKLFGSLNRSLLSKEVHINSDGKGIVLAQLYECIYIGMCRNTRSFLKRVELNDPGRNVSSSLLTFCQALPQASGGDKSRTGWEMSAGGAGQADPISVCEAIDQTGGFKIFSFFQLSNSSFKNYYSHMLSVKWVGIPPIQQLFV